MGIAAESVSLSPSITTNLTNAQLRYLLDQIAAQFSLDAALIYEFDSDTGRLEIISELERAPLDSDTRKMLNRELRSFIDGRAPGYEPVLLTDHTLPFASVAVYPLALPYQIIGLLVLVSSKSKAFKQEQLENAYPQVSLAQTLLENVQLHRIAAQHRSTAQSILVTAEAIAENPSPQHVVNILHDTLFDTHVSSCAMLLYGPVREDNPNGPFEYLEIRGTWSKRHGSGVGIGVRLYLKDYPDLLTQLEERKVLIFRDLHALQQRFDPLIRGFLWAERIRALTMLPLQSARNKLGVIVIGTDKMHDFGEQELHSYRTVTEFLAISAMAQVLRQQHDRVQQIRAALLDAVTDAVVMVLPHGHGGHVLTVNEQFTRLFEVADKRAQGLSLVELLGEMGIPEDTRKELRSAWLSTPVRDPSITRGSFFMKSNDGQPLAIEWSSEPVYQDQSVLGRIYIFHDVTAERLAARLRAAFLSKVSHELRTPLTSIQGFAEFTLQLAGDKLPDQAREYIEIILGSAKHLNHVFTDMIEITRAEAGELKLDLQDYHLPDIIIDTVARMELQYKKRKQKVIMELDDDLPPVHVDSNRMIQVITNLLTNAIKYSPEGGKIYIKTEYVGSADKLPQTAPQDVVIPGILVTVRDEGKGLTSEDAEQVFLPFYRTEAAKAGKMTGVGLGLAITRSIVEVQRGKIWAVPNDQVQGGVFMFTIPTVRR